MLEKSLTLKTVAPKIHAFCNHPYWRLAMVAKKKKATKKKATKKKTTKKKAKK
jgi:hypothetical protein